MKRILSLVGFIWCAPLLFSGLPSLKITGAEVYAQTGDQASKAKKKKKTRKVPAMTERTYKVLAEAQIMIDPESAPREEGEPVPVPTGTPRDAVAMLQKLLESRRINEHERAQIWNILAFAYYSLEDVPKTIDAYQQVLNQGENSITEGFEKAVTQSLFQLLYAQERYQEALQYIARWEKLNEGPESGVTHIKAISYYQMENFRESLKWAKEVERLAGLEGKPMKERWYSLQVVLYNELKDVDNQIRVLETMVVLFPKKQYWMHLAGMYGEKGLDDKALSAFYAVYRQGLFSKESELVMLSQRLLNAEVPYEAATILEEGFKQGTIKETEKNLKLLATCYTLSQEMSKAIDAWRDATKYAENGNLHYRLAQALSQEDRHKEAIKSYRDALDFGGLDDPSDAQFWLGISLMQLEDWNDATKAFREAARGDKKMEKQARQYIRYIAGEKRRQEELRKMLEGP